MVHLTLQIGPGCWKEERNKAPRLQPFLPVVMNGRDATANDATFLCCDEWHGVFGHCDHQGKERGTLSVGTFVTFTMSLGSGVLAIWYCPLVLFLIFSFQEFFCIFWKNGIFWYKPNHWPLGIQRVKLCGLIKICIERASCTTNNDATD